MHDYDFRGRVAAKLDVHEEWSDIVRKHDRETAQELEALLRKLVPYLRSVGYDLDVNKSYLDKYYSGSDGVRMDGALHVTEREENNTYATEGRRVAEWVGEATGLSGSAKKIGELPGRWSPDQKRGIWLIDITST